MPKAYDVKHNYYADLDLPTSASCDEVKKQYRKLALQYHPDRNAGKEEEYIPKFQAIQAAHEILGEPAEKNRYDGDRRKAGLYPGGGGGGGAASTGTGTRGNPYQATSNYPPPPRRTQPGTWNRPPATGADRFTNFPRQAPTAKKPDPAAERQNAFRAWQNMNNAQDRQQQQSRYTQPSPQPPPKTASPRRPPPPPRGESKFPTDEKIRAGFNYREPPQPSGSADNAEERQSAWAAFQKSQKGTSAANSPGIKRSNTSKAPKKAGFDPNVPGSDEGMAPDSQYAHRHKSADFGRPNVAPPPPPRPSEPGSPLSTPQRPHPDPLRPFKSRTGDDDAPYSEGNRVRTPYSSFSGERTDFGGDMRRSNSTRDAYKMNSGSTDSRARSSSPPSASKANESQTRARSNQGKPSFSVGGSSSTSSDSSEPESAGASERQHMPPQNRPKIIPSPPSRRYNGTANPTSPPPGNGRNFNEGGMGQKTNSNMYVRNNPLAYSTERGPLSAELLSQSSRLFGFASTKDVEQRKNPIWAVPPCLLPRQKRKQHFDGDLTDAEEAQRGTTPLSDPISYEEQSAFTYFKGSVGFLHGSVPPSLDMELFLRLASTARAGKSSSPAFLDTALQTTLAFFPSIGFRPPLKQIPEKPADNAAPSRFNFPTSPDMFTRTKDSKSRSEESINTKFSADGWSGTFNGSSEYFAPPQASSRRGSPSLRGGQRPNMRPTTSSFGQPSFGQPSSTVQSPDATTMPPPPRPQTGNTDGAFSDQPSAGSDTKFSKDQWEQTFKDHPWAWPPPPSMPPPSPSKGGIRAKQPSRKNSRARSKTVSSGNGTAANPHVVDEDDDQTVDPTKVPHQPPNGHSAVHHEPDAMDIDNTPPATEHPAQQQPHPDHSKEPRLVSVPPSAWRQSQQSRPSSGHNRTTSNGSNSGPIKTNLNDLANVAPFTQTSDGSGLQDLKSMSASLPFTSQAANTLPTNPLKPQTLSTPIVPIPPKSPSRLTKQAWHQYAQNFGLYLHAFNSFNNAMLQHFLARDQQSAARMLKGTAWLEAVGDPAAGGGFGSYAREVKEDELVRETWRLGCERRADAVGEFEEVRERLRRLGAVGGGVEV